jgi:hypothetical protein
MYPYDLYQHFYDLINHRYIKKYYLIDTGLDPWKYHESEDRILHGMFNVLVDFVEIEKTNMTILSYPERQLKKSTRSRELGLEYLEWEMTQEYENHYTRQAIHAKEIYELYVWWKDVRPNRPDPYDISGWSDYCDRRDAEKGEDSFFDFDNEDRTESRAIHNVLSKIEQDYETEDTHMLTRLIKIRRELWT